MLLVIYALSYDSAYGKIGSITHDLKWFEPIGGRNYGHRDKFYFELLPRVKTFIIKDERHILC